MVPRESVPSSETVRVRFGEMDGLRAIAILAALVFEATRIASPAAHWHPVLARIFSDASQSFSLFFLLSGFVLAYPAFAMRREDGRSYLDVGRYLVKRALRIYPAYLVVLALTFIVPTVAMQYGLPALASGSAGLGSSAFFQHVFFLGSGLGNDGFRVLALEARWFLLFPALLVLWDRFPKVFIGLAAVVMLGDLFLAFIHATGIGALVPFMLGMIAADVRAGRLHFERISLPVAGVAAILAVVLEPFVALLPGPSGAPGAFRVDPFWTVALFGLIAGIGGSAVLERILSARPLRFLGAASYGIALVMVPVSSFVVRQALSTIGQTYSAINAGVFSALAGIVVWQLADRWFAEGNLRLEVAGVAGPWVDRVLAFARIDRVVIGREPELVPYAAEHAAVDASFYAPPPRPDADLASISTRSGSPEDLAAEIMEMKKRLADRSNAIFAEAEPQSEPVPEPEPEPFERPGFYRRSTDNPPAGLSKPAPSAGPKSPPVKRVISAAPAYVEPTPISISFEPSAPAATTPPYEHYTFEPSAAPAAPAPERTLSAVPPPQNTLPSNRGPIKMRLGVVPDKTSSNGNRKFLKADDSDA